MTTTWPNAASSRSSSATRTSCSATRRAAPRRVAGTRSIAVAAKANGLNPRKYVQWLLEEMPNAKDPGGPAYLDSLMPWSESVPADIRLRSEAAEKAARMTDDPIIDIAPSAFRDDKEK